MAFKIPNEADAFHANQAEPDSVDFDILVQALVDTGVISGCAMTVAGTDMIVAVAAGVVAYQGTRATVTGGNITIPAADATNPRFDLIMVSNAGALITPSPGDGKGTAAAEPVFPTIPANRVVLGAVYIPATDTAIASNQITDKRITVGVPQPAAKIRSTGSQDPPDGVWTQVSILTVLDYDNDDIADLAGSRLVCKTAGVYLISAGVALNAATPSAFEITKNGSGIGTGTAGLGSTSFDGQVTVQAKLAVNDVIVLQVKLTVGVTVATNLPAGTHLAMVKVSDG